MPTESDSKRVWLSQLRQLVGIMPSASEIDLHKGRSGLSRALSTLHKSKKNSTLAAIQDLLERWEAARLSTRFDPSRDDRREQGLELGTQLVEACDQWLGKHGSEDQADTIRAARDSAATVVGQCQDWEMSRDLYTQLAAQHASRLQKALAETRSLSGLEDEWLEVSLLVAEADVGRACVPVGEAVGFLGRLRAHLLLAPSLLGASFRARKDREAAAEFTDWGLGQRCQPP